MVNTPLPPQEPQRLQTLHSLQLLDTEPEERFDRIIRMAARLFDVPIALFSLIDRDRLWFKARLGFDQIDYPRAESICAHTIANDGMLVVSNPAGDARFAAFPALQGASAIRFYAGVPVRAPDGNAIGTLCVADMRPRRLDSAQRALLADLAATIESEVAAGALRRARQQQRENEVSMTGLLDTLPEGVLLLGANGRVISANPAAERLFRGADGALENRPASALLVADIGPIVQQVEQGTGMQLQAMARRLDGRTFAAEFSARLVHARAGKRYVVIVRDVSPRRESERRDRDTDARRRKYFVTATHELRTPMASVVGFTELLLKRDFSADSVREFIGIIHAQSTRLVTLINEMLDLARIESGGSEALDIKPNDLAAVLDDTLAGIDDRAAIALDVAPGLPPVMADAAKLQQALLNLIGNAVKYSPPGAPVRIAARPALHDAHAAIAIRVTDEGIGMTPEQQASAFEPFYRASARGGVIGSGLGLTIVKEIAELHGGGVSLDSMPGAGTTVTLVIPVAA